VAERAEDDLVFVDKQLVIRRTSRGLSVSGVIDHYNVDSFARSLTSSLDGEGDLNVDLSELEFCDVSGIRALVRAAECLDGGRRLVLHGLPPQLRTVMTVVGWTNLPGLVVSEPEEPDR
jgi:anti-anti-sigma factor